MSKLIILRGQSIKWRFTLTADGQPFDITNIQWNVIYNELNLPLTFTTINALGGVLEVKSSYTNTQVLKPAVGKTIRIQGITSLNQEAFVLQLPLIDVR